MRRLFISINIPDDIKQAISKKKDILESMLPGAKFIKEINWHLTIVFLGYQEDEAILPIIEGMQSVCSKFEAPEIILNNISYAPPKGAPRMIWLNGTEESSKKLAPLKIVLEDELINNRVRFGLEKRIFNAHLTLAKFSEISKKELPEIDGKFKNLNWSFIPESLDLIESHVSKGGSKYEVLQKFEFLK
jgi:2'-5' RNA ligase